jgi:hypothetical protein
MKLVGAIAAVIAAVFVGMFPPQLAARQAPLAEYPPASHYAMTAGSQLDVACPGHLGEDRPGSPYVLDCAALAPSPPTTTTTVPVPPLNAPVAQLMAASIFDRPVTTWSVNPNSAAWVADFVSDYQDNYGSVGVNTLPIYDVPAGTPESAMSVRFGCNNFLASTGDEVPVPAFTNLNGSSDDPLALYDPSTDQAWEFWQVSKAGNSYQACWGGGAPLTSFDGVFPGPFGLSATGISYLATTVTEADIASGAIDHAVSVILPPSCSPYVAPAVRGDCHGTTGQPSEGQWFRFAPGTAMPAGLTPFGQMVFRAILTYGMVVTDQGGAVMLEAEQSSDWAAEGHSGTDPITTSWQGKQEYQVVANLPWASLQALNYPGASSVSSGLPSPPAPYFVWPGKGPA